MAEQDEIANLAVQVQANRDAVQSAAVALSRDGTPGLPGYFNVMDFGAKGDLETDDQSAIQAAVDKAGEWGGTVYFPPGAYLIKSRINVANQSKGITLLGCGGREAGGSRIYMNARDYMIYCAHGYPNSGGYPMGGGNTLVSIEKLFFNNSYDGPAPTSTEPANTIDNTDGDGCGCIYYSGAVGSTIRDCVIQVSTGIGIFNTGYHNCIENIIIQGSYGAPGDVNKSIGILTRGSSIRNGKLYALGTAICCIAGTSIISYLNIEVSGIGVMAGFAPIAYWDSNNAEGSITWPGNNYCGIETNHLTMESLNDTFIWLRGPCTGSIGGISIASYGQIGVPKYGVRCELFYGGFISAWTSGTFSVAAIDASFCKDTTFKNCSAGTSGPGVNWILPTGFEAPSSGAYWDRCDIDGALPFSVFPQPATNGALMTCSDSADPAFGDRWSNVGKPLTGGSTNKVLARWDGTQWCIAG